ncbi:MAG: YjjG family noncanonical pyrimidine nucleotidase [Muricoprocola sp.]
MKKRILFFDLDNTIFDFTKAEKIALSKTLSQMGMEPTEEVCALYSKLNMEQWKLLELGKVTRNQVKVRRYENLFRELNIDTINGKSVEELAAQAASTYEHLLGIGHYYMEGAEDLIRDLAPRYDLYLVTNGTRSVQDGRLASAEIRPLFKGVFISEEIGYEKPGKEYFDRCFAQMPEFKLEEALLIGDSLTADIRGGENTGMETVWFNPSGAENHTDIVPTYEIKKLKELYQILGE